MNETRSGLAGVQRGNCPECGYLGLLTARGELRDHAVRRVRFGADGKPERYESLAVGDDHCTGAGWPPLPLPKPNDKYERIAS